MSHERFDRGRWTELRQRATLREYRFTSAAPGVGRLVARVREAWNNVATRPQVWPMAERQSAFNHALLDHLERRRPGLSDGPPGDGLSRDLIAHDRAGTRLNRDVAATTTRLARLRGDLDAPGNTARRLRVAYFSPLPPARSGIADYSAELLPHLAARAEVTLFTDQPDMPLDLPRRPLHAFAAERWGYDVALYQMGNSAHHAALYRLLLRFPGVVVLHDTVLHHFIADQTLGRGSFPAYAREMAYALGETAAPRLLDIRAGRAPNPLHEVALNERLIDSSLGLIVHSRAVAERIRADRPETLVQVIPHLVEPRPVRSRRAELGLPEGAVLLAAVGQVTAAKQLLLALRAFGRLLAFVPEARFLIVGEVLPEVDLDGALAEQELGERVIRLGHVPSFDAFNEWAAAADIVLGLRHPTLGETSGAALRAMVAGRALVVFDHGWYAEIPDDAALKVPPLDEEALLAGLLELARSPERRAALGAAAARYVAEQCAPAAVVAAYLDFLTLATEPRR